MESSRAVSSVRRSAHYRAQRGTLPSATQTIDESVAEVSAKYRELDELLRKGFEDKDAALRRYHRWTGELKCEVDHLRQLVQGLEAELEAVRSQNRQLQTKGETELKNQLDSVQEREHSLAQLEQQVRAQWHSVLVERESQSQLTAALERREALLRRREEKLVADRQLFEAALVPAKADAEANMLRSMEDRRHAEQLYAESLEAVRALARRREDLERTYAATTRMCNLATAESEERWVIASTHAAEVHALMLSCVHGAMSCTDATRTNSYCASDTGRYFTTSNPQRGEERQSPLDQTQEYRTRTDERGRPSSSSGAQACDGQHRNSYERMTTHETTSSRSSSSTSYVDMSPLQRLQRVYSMVETLQNTATHASNARTASHVPLLSTQARAYNI